MVYGELITIELVTSIAPFVVTLAWVGAVTAGHTKRTLFSSNDLSP